VKKIPQAVLARCEWGRDDYSLNVTEQAPVVAVEEAKAEASTSSGTSDQGRRAPQEASADASAPAVRRDRGFFWEAGREQRMTSRHVNTITGRLSLRSPQRRSLEILDRVMEIAQPHKGGDLKAALDIIRSEFPSVEDFEHAFPSLCFALATGVGKTRLMGAFITYLHLEHGIRHFFVLAPNLTIYNKLLADFTPNTPKYVFQGIAEFAVKAPTLVTGENFEQKPQVLDLFERDDVVVNIFNISKFNEKAKGTDEEGKKTLKVRRLSEFLGQSYFDYLAGLDDLVLIMDEAHRYRADTSAKSIEELKPVLGLELTATPQIESASKSTRFKNVIFDYPLAKAMQDGYVKEPAVATRANFNPKSMSKDALELLKLEDGVRVHESAKVDLDVYAQQNGVRRVKPFMLVIAEDTDHASELVKLIEGEQFFDGRYKGRVIQVHSGQRGAEKDENVEKLLSVERTDSADGDRRPRQHAQGGLGRHEPLHDRPAAHGGLAHAGRAVDRPWVCASRTASAPASPLSIA
jgi:type III restriction enzyme